MARDHYAPCRTNPQALVALAAAVSAVTIAGLPARAGIDNTENNDGGQLTVISTTGATALGAFNTAVSSNRRILNLGVPELYIGKTKYTLAAGAEFGTEVLSPVNNTGAALDRDRWAYTFHQTGSVEGILELADGYGLNSTGTPLRPRDPTSGNPTYISGNTFSQPAFYNNAGDVVTPDTIQGHVLGRNYRNVGDGNVRGPQSTTPAPIQTGQVAPKIAWSDVGSSQAFAVSGTASATATPTTPGYGLGRSKGANNFQQLRNITAIAGGQANFRNETVAIVPFTLSANPGTGLEGITKADAAFLNATGRLANGANFNAVTRDIGSGTRNQGGNNLGIDPSFASGERDRVAAGSFTANGITYAAGDEVDPLVGLPGATGGGDTNVYRNEDRISPQIKFADKTSGSSRVRPVLLQSRMGVGILSAGDVSTRGLETAKNSGEQLRVLKIDWNGDTDIDEAVAPTADNVSTGAYQMWSAAQAVTVIDNTPGAAADAIRGDTPDNSPNGDNRGHHRKFLDNIQQSASNFPLDTATGDSTTAAPADGILRGNFLLPKFMKVEKTFDGAPQTNINPDGSRDDEAGYAGWKSGGGDAGLNWAEPSLLPGYDLNGTDLRYNVFAADNFTGTPTKAIVVTERTALAGDFNNDDVRDLADVAKLAQARTNPAAYLGSAEGSTVGVGTGTGTVAADGIIVLGDLDSNGSFDKADVKYFLYGASVDTLNANAATGYAGSADAAVRRTAGVTGGQLKKNAAIDAYNAALTTLGVAADSPERFDKFDVNGDGTANRLDAQAVDRNVGRNMTVLSDVLASSDDLVAVELNDNNAITHVVDITGQSDMKLIKDALGSTLSGGDSNFDGLVDVVDLGILGSNYGATSGAKWSTADWSFDGAVDVVDLGILGSNYGFGLGLTESAAFALFLSDLQGFPVLAEAYAAVPEPGSIGVLAVAGVAMLGRRSRRGN